MNAAQESGQPHEDAQRHFATLYTVVVAFSIENAAENLFGNSNLQTIPLVGAFFVTLVPFYVGAVRHLESAPRSRAPRWPSWPVVDFGCLFSEALLLLYVAKSTLSALHTAASLTLLLAVDVIWAGLTNMQAGKPDAHVDRWFRWNLQFLVGCIGLGGAVWALNAFNIVRPHLAWLLFAGATLRTIVDYRRNQSFYLGD